MQIDIIQAMRDKNLFASSFRDLTTWRAWQIYLKALFGLGIANAKDRKLFRECTGLYTPPKEGVRESYIIAGRRSGKSFISAMIAVYLAAFGDWSKFLSPGEKGWIFILSVDKLQSRITKGYIQGIIKNSKHLENLITRETAEEIELKGGVIIAIKTSSFRSVRGYTLLAAILEELAFWRSEESANPDKEILAALRPALATIPESRLIAISTPYSRSGVMWEQYRSHFGKPGGPLIWQAKTEIMNPSIDRRLIEKAIQEDPEFAKSEWLCEWRSDISQFLPLELVESAVIPGRLELPYHPGINYQAFGDPAGGSGEDSFTMAISHRESNGKVVIDCLRERRPKFSPESVAEEFSSILKSYGLSKIRIDRYAGSWVQEAFSRYGIAVEYSDLSASELYLNFLPMISSGSIELLDIKRLISQLTQLERRTRSGGKDLVTHYPGSHDDLANSIAGTSVMSAIRPTVEHHIIWVDDGPSGFKSWEREWILKANQERQTTPEDPQILALNSEEFTIKFLTLMQSGRLLCEIGKILNVEQGLLNRWHGSQKSYIDKVWRTRAGEIIKSANELKQNTEKESNKT